MLFKKQIREIGRKDGRAEPLEVENGGMRVTVVKGGGGEGEGRYLSTAAAVDEEHGMAEEGWPGPACSVELPLLGLWYCPTLQAHLSCPVRL